MTGTCHNRRVFERLRAPYDLRDYQRQVIDAVAGRDNAWVVLPPGAGKTLTGFEAARRRGEPIVVFAPNTAIQGQWLELWGRYRPADVRATADRALPTPVTVLTYQSLASFDPDAEVHADGRQRSPMHRLRAGGRELVDALRATGRITLVLDECHHLLDTWGTLIDELLRDLPEATVIGLTATPPSRLGEQQAELVARLFGEPVTGPSVPAVVRTGHLAPFTELAWLVTPTAAERDWLAAEAVRFAELTTDVLTPEFLAWLDARIVRRANATTGAAVPWPRFARDHPALALAALRMHHAGLLDLPHGARLREEHRRPPTADDWVALIGDYATRGLPDGSPRRAAIRAALPSVGYQLTSRGVRGGRSPIDRVLARSEAKTAAVREILAGEYCSLGEQLRAVVMCDYERASATLPARLEGVLDAQAGSARLVLAELAADPRTEQLAPILVTGRTVAAPASVAREFAAFCAEQGVRLDAVPDDGLVELTGPWESRTWVPLATRFFEDGGTRALIGTRALLGEGWDAHTVNTLVDLTEATTATSVVQTRGRALRLDPAWPDKVANNWSVVCVSPDHPRGAADWDRFVRKHDGYFAVTGDGTVAAGVAHVDPGLSPYAPPDAAEFDAFNAAMLERAAERAKVRELWRIGSDFADRPVHAVRVRTPRTAAGDGRAAGQPPDAVPGPRGVRGLPWWARVRALRWLRAAGDGPDLYAVAAAVAEALRGAGLIGGGPEAVRIEPDGSGHAHVEVVGVSTAESRVFATALDEVLSAPADPRYLVPRYVVAPPGPLAAVRALTGVPYRNAVVHHAVPAVLGDRRDRADRFARAWNRWISAGTAIYTRTPEGAALLTAQDGGSPLDATTALRVTWS